MEEQEENIQPKDIAACRAAFEMAMAKIDAAMKKPMMAKTKMMAIPGPFIVYFDFNSAKVTVAANGVIDHAAAAAKKMNLSQVLISGHADRSGATKYNTVLSKTRVDAVALALIAAGVSASAISKSIFGEDKPLVQTDDGKREWRNRRVEITLKK